MIKISGNLAIQSRNGKFGKFNVGHLTADLGDFSVRSAELDQYPEGKYDGEFCISKIKKGSYETNSGYIVEIRATVDSMTLFGVEKLTKEDAKKLSHQEPDPMVEEMEPDIAATPKQPVKAKGQFGAKTRKAKTTKSAPEQENDEELFGILWPLGDVVKLDATVNRLILSKQIARMQALGYEIQLDQHWHRKS